MGLKNFPRKFGRKWDPLLREVFLFPLGQASSRIVCPQRQGVVLPDSGVSLLPPSQREAAE